MDTLGFEPRAFRMRSGCDTTTPCAQMMNLKSASIQVQSYINWIMRRKQTCSKCGQSSWRSSSQFSSAVLNVSSVNSGAKDAQWQFFKVAGLLRCFCSCSFSESHYSTLSAAGFSSANKRHRRDSNPCGQSPMDF